MSEKLRKAMETFITQRIEDLGSDSPENVDEAIANVSCCSEALAQTLTSEQIKLWNALELAFSLQTGEETRYYYKSGFEDAIHFLMNWSEK